ncbi:MAG: hypothetical protein LQ347_004938 [Umbilicaria vellea]|nr:MAG: hypothetical protein LQ347_004938 [Umbilicaria vellea]
MSKSAALKHYERALAQWPVDLLRPEVSLQNAMRRRINKRFHPSTTRPQDNVVANGALATVPVAPRLDDRAELEQANVLYSFIENRYTKKVRMRRIRGLGVCKLLTLIWKRSQYPITQNLTKPVSNPSYYEDLMKELQEAPQRSWLSRILNKWKGFLRFS